MIWRSVLALIVAVILGAAQGCRRLVRGVIAESGTPLTLATAPVSAKIGAKARLATTNEPLLALLNQQSKNPL